MSDGASPGQTPEAGPKAGSPLAWPAEPRPAGVSIVTCSRNRTANLIRALPTWLACPEVSEIVVVDWGSDRPVAAELAAARLTDPRIRIARVANEPRWILSYAFNIGFRLARFDRILKADADITLAPGFFAANPLPPEAYIAGNWRRASQGQSFVNGFFYTHAANLQAVNGFNEYITTYGWDDDELYDRLTDQGCRRIDVATGTISHLDHDDEARLNAGLHATESGWDDLHSRTMFKIRTNRMLATMMPVWNRDRIMLPMRYRDPVPGEGELALERDGFPMHVVSAHLRTTAERLAAREMLAWSAGLRVYELPDSALDILISCRRFDTIRALHVELMLANDTPGAGIAAATAPRHLVLDIDEGALMAGPAALAPLVGRLQAAALRCGRWIVWRAMRSSPPAVLPPPLASAPFIPAYLNIGPTRKVEADEIPRDVETPALRIEIGLADLASGGPSALPPPPGPEGADADHVQAMIPPPVPRAILPAPAVQNPPQRLYIDLQHGLGNRLRALGSADAVARATDRDLVVIWTPDHHCEARLSELFHHDGTVLEESFPAEAAARGMTLLNYMEIEPGSAKGAPLVLEDGRDAYVRSAYVIAHPASTWESENRLLRSLRPVAAVEALIAPFPAEFTVGLHVRMEGAPGTDRNSYDAPENWTAEGHAAINHWREQSHYGRFMARLDALIAADPGLTAWLAADMEETYRAFAETYGDRVRRLDRTVYDRSAEQAQYALADMLLLARSRHLLGSNWSSFTEAALRMSSTITRQERAGVDF